MSEIKKGKCHCEAVEFEVELENDFRFGGGLSYQFGNKLKGSKSMSATTTKFKDSMGFVLEGDYFVGADNSMAVGLRYTEIKYHPEISGKSSVNGNSFGFNFNYFL